jgi:hypothetical protein
LAEKYLTTSLKPRHWIYNDGGRAAAGFRGKRANDCVTRAIAIATGLTYQETFNLVNLFLDADGRGPMSGIASAGTGVPKDITRKVLKSLGWQWVPTMGFGTGCRVHLRW